MNEEGNANIEDLIEVVDVEEQDDDGNEISNTPFINPSQGDLLPSGIISARFVTLYHKESCYNWCSLCYSSFKTQEKLKTHVKDVHSDK